eukprot:1030804-Rhodomonas_salina.1
MPPRAGSSSHRCLPEPAPRPCRSRRPGFVPAQSALGHRVRFQPWRSDDCAPCGVGGGFTHCLVPGLFRSDDPL